MSITTRVRRIEATFAGRPCPYCQPSMRPWLRRAPDDPVPPDAVHCRHCGARWIVKVIRLRRETLEELARADAQLSGRARREVR